MPRDSKVGVGVAGLLIRSNPKKQEILLIKRQGSHAEGVWAVPGGWIDKTDADPVQALIREFKEELDITIKPTAVTVLSFVGIADFGEFSSVTVHYRILSDKKESPKILEPEKCSEFKWWDVQEVLKQSDESLFPGLKTAIQQLVY